MDLKRWPARALRKVVHALWPNQRLRWTREGIVYALIWGVLMVMGLVQENNLILLAAGLAAGPIISSVLSSAAMLRRVAVQRRAPAYVFSGQPLKVEYVLENLRKRSAALALTVEDELVPLDRSIPGGARQAPKVFFGRVPPRQRARKSWTAKAPARGRYRFRTKELMTAAPFGLLERRVVLTQPGTLTVYPQVGTITRRLFRAQRESAETTRGHRHDRSAQPLEFHGMREYRPGDSIRAIHWRTTARVGKVMVKEFEVQRDRDLALLLDPWLPRHQATEAQREAVEESIRFAATVCLETCRKAGRRLLLGWSGMPPVLLQGPASVKLLHELLDHLAVLKGTSEGQLAPLLELIPPAALREAMLVVVATRPVNLAEQVFRAARGQAAWMRGALTRALVLDASRGELADYFRLGPPAAEAGPARKAKP